MHIYLFIDSKLQERKRSEKSEVGLKGNKIIKSVFLERERYIVWVYRLKYI